MLALDIAQIRAINLTMIFMLILARPIWNFISTCIRMAVRKSWNKGRAGALKIATNSVYGLTSAKFENPFGDENEE